MNNDAVIKKLLGLALELPPKDQYRLAFFIAENIGFYLKKPEEGKAVEEIMDTIKTENNQK